MTDFTKPTDRARFARSFAYRERALQHLAYGVSSTPRATQQPVPLALERADGVHITDVDGNRYIDFALGYGPLILGHSPAPVIAAIQAELHKGLRTASVHPGEAELADLIAQCVPSAEQTNFVSSGTEAIQLALRIARAATGKVKVVKFRANYHGWFDNVHVANSLDNDGASTIGQDPQAADAVTLVDWGDAAALEAVLDSSFAAVILEPAAVNAGCFEPPAGFLERVRAATKRHGVVLIFDEVITGFRLALGGAQERYGVTPDLSVLGKALGAGLPISAVSGTRDVMAVLSEGKLMHRGTFNGNPVSVAAAVACLNYLRTGQETIYPRMDNFAAQFKDHLNAEAVRLDVPVCARQAGPAVQIFAGLRQVGGLKDTVNVDKALTVAFTAELLRAGIYTLPRGLCYLSTAHAAEDIDTAKSLITSAMTEFASGLAA
jgi:glutamate-1-semialdehyde 2,1-aminomutase